MQKDKFVSHISQVLEKNVSGIKVEPISDKFAVNIQKNGQNHELILDNIYRDYLNVGDDEVFEHVISFLSGIEDHKEESVLNFHSDKLIPHIRRVFDDDIKNKFILHPLNEEVEMCFALDFPDHVRYVTKDMLNDLFTKEKVRRKSMENLLKRGWLNEVNNEHSHAGKMLLYKNYDHIYQAQFFIPEMAKNFLANEFYFILPARSVSVVLIPNHVNKKGVLEGILKLKEFAVKILSQESHTISEKVFHFKQGKINIIG